MKSNLTKRLISSLVMTPLVLCVIVWGDTDFAPFYAILMAVLGSLMAWEWEKMVSGKVSSVAVTLAMMATMLALLGMEVKYPSFSLLLIAAVAAFIYFKNGKNVLLSFGAFYIGLPIISMMYIAYPNFGYNNEIVLWVLFVVWATDVGGYVFGKSIGGVKLAPRISPNKTWAGLIGGILTACFVTYEFVRYMSTYQHSQMSMAFFVGSSALLAVVAQAGDIFESAIKRYLNLKDSSHIIPGHGGIFDRVDGLLFAAPVVALFLLLNNLGWITL